MHQKKTFICFLLVTFLAGCGSSENATPEPKTTTSLPPMITTASLTNTPQPSPFSTLLPPSTAEGLIVFYSERDGDAELYLMNPDGSNGRQLTTLTGIEVHEPLRSWLESRA
jgi:hypothetical protein